jgi:hypothetical protein
MKLGGQFKRLLCDMKKRVPCDPTKAPCWRHTQAQALTHSDGPTPILVGSSSSGGVWAGACLVWGSGIDRLWNWAGANLVLHARAGEVSAKMEARLRCICAYCFSAIEVMHAYECAWGNKCACSRTWITKRQACNLIIITILDIIIIICRPWPSGQGGHTLLPWGRAAWVRSPPTPTHKTCLLSAVGDWNEA